MKYYAHTALDGDGDCLPEQAWQPLADHLRNVAALARGFAAAFDAEKEAELAGLLHDLGKYAARFQQRLHNPAIHGINHWASGAETEQESCFRTLVSYDAPTTRNDRRRRTRVHRILGSP